MSDPARPALPAWLEAIPKCWASLWDAATTEYVTTEIVRVADFRAAWQQQEPDALRRAAQTVYDAFVRDEAAGYRSKDRQYAIAILAAGLRVDLLHETPDS